MREQGHCRYYRRCVRKIPYNTKRLAPPPAFAALAMCWAGILVALVVVVLLIVKTIIAELAA